MDIILKKIDFSLLAKQKAILINMIQDWIKSNDAQKKQDAEEAEGLLCLLDTIEDENEGVEPKWICTDPDTKQYGRYMGNRTYEFREEMRWTDQSVTSKECDINLYDYTSSEINSTLSAYGWSIELLLNENSFLDAEWLMAECLFEMD